MRSAASRSSSSQNLSPLTSSASLGSALNTPNKKTDPEAYYLRMGITQTRINFLKKVFNSFDASGDGSINPKELSDAILSLGLKFKPRDVYRLMSLFDGDGDGSIGFREFLDMMISGDHGNQNLKQLQLAAKTLSENKSYTFEVKIGQSLVTEEEVNKIIASIPKDKLNRYEYAFAMLDADGGGSINPKELETSLIYLQHDISKEDIYELLSEIDTNGDGSLSLKEFLCAMGTKECSRIVRTLRVVAKEIIEGKKMLPRAQKLRSYKRRLTDPNKLNGWGLNEGDFKEISDFFDALDYEAQDVINIKAIASRRTSLDDKVNENEKKILDWLCSLSQDTVGFDEFLTSYLKNTFAVKDLISLKQYIVPLLSQRILEEVKEVDEIKEISEIEETPKDDRDYKQELRELSTKMKDLEEKYSDLETDRAMLMDEKTHLMEDKTNLMEEISKMLEEKIKLQENLDNRDRMISELEEEIDEKTEKLAEVEKALANHKETHEKLNIHITSLSEKVGVLDDETKRKDKEKNEFVELTQKEMREAESQLARLKKDSEGIIAKLTEDLRKKIEEIDNLKRQCQELKNEKDATAQTLLEKEKQAQLEALERIKQENGKLSDEIKELEKKLAEQKCACNVF